MTVLRCACGERIEGRGAALLEAVEAHLDAGHHLDQPPSLYLARPDTARDDDHGDGDGERWRTLRTDDARQAAWRGVASERFNPTHPFRGGTYD